MSYGGEGVEVIGQGAPDGATFQQATTEKLSFYGVTPVVQQTGVTITTTSAATSTSPWGFSGSTQANLLINDVYGMHAALVQYGLLDA